MRNCICVDCGEPVTYLRTVPEPRCKDCLRKRHNAQNVIYQRKQDPEYQREWHRQNYHKRHPEAVEQVARTERPRVNIELVHGEPVHVVAVADDVRDSEDRWLLSGYVDGSFPAGEFAYSATSGYLDGLVVEHNARRYAIRDGQFEEVGR